MAPFNGGAQRLMARQGRAAPSRQQAEPVGQAIEDLLHGEDARPDRGELDRQRQPVVPLAHVLIGALDECALYIARAEDPVAAREQCAAIFDRVLLSTTPDA